jgi:putative transposase
MSHTHGNILLHLIFSTHQRRPLIKPEFQSELFAYLGGIIRELDGVALIINGTADHVHMLVRIRPTHSASEIARVVKTNSSRWTHEKWRPDFAWQTGYGVFQRQRIQRRGCDEIHRQPGRTSQEEDEFLAFLKKNGIAYDEKYVWD